MVPGDERYERLKHQSLFLHARGLMSPEMEESKRQLWLFERLAGKDPGTFDPHLVDRVHGELERVAIEQLRATGLLEEWLESWEARNEIVDVPALVPTHENPRLPAPRIDRESTADVDGNPPRRSLEDKLAELEHAVQLLGEHLAGVRKADEPHASP
jgi:hypothetical protein